MNRANIKHCIVSVLCFVLMCTVVCACTSSSALSEPEPGNDTAKNEFIVLKKEVEDTEENLSNNARRPPPLRSRWRMNGV